MKRCTHSGPFRVAQAMLGDREGDVAVFCMGCCGFQRPRLDPEKPWPWPQTDPWCGTAPELPRLPEDVCYQLLSAPILDLVHAHRVALKMEIAAAACRLDEGYFIRIAVVPPWMESKRDERTGDLLVRPRSGWSPDPVEIEDVHGAAA